MKERRRLFGYKNARIRFTSSASNDGTRGGKKSGRERWRN